MKADIYLDFTATLTGRRVHDPDTGPDEVEDIELETVYMFDREWNNRELRDEFGNLADWIIGTVDSGDFE